MNGNFQQNQFQQELNEMFDKIILENQQGNKKGDEFYAQIYQLSQKLIDQQAFPFVNENPNEIPQLNQWYFVPEKSFSQRKFLQQRLNIKMVPDNTINMQPNWNLFDVKTYTKDKYLVRIVKIKNRYCEQRFQINNLKKQYLVLVTENQVEQKQNQNQENVITQKNQHIQDNNAQQFKNLQENSLNQLQNQQQLLLQQQLQKNQILQTLNNTKMQYQQNQNDVIDLEDSNESEDSNSPQFESISQKQNQVPEKIPNPQSNYNTFSNNVLNQPMNTNRNTQVNPNNNFIYQKEKVEANYTYNQLLPMDQNSIKNPSQTIANQVANQNQMRIPINNNNVNNQFQPQNISNNHSSFNSFAQQSYLQQNLIHQNSKSSQIQSPNSSRQQIFEQQFFHLQQLNRRDKQIEQLELQLMEKDKKISVLEKELELKQNLSEQIKQKDDILINLQSKIQKLEESLSQNEMEEGKFDTEVDKIIELTKEKTQEYAQVIQQQISAITYLQEQIHTLDEKYKSLYLQEQNLRQECLVIQRINGELQEQLAIQKSVNDNILIQNQENIDTIRQFEISRDTYLQQNENLQKNNKILKKKIAKRQNKIHKLKAQSVKIVKQTFIEKRKKEMAQQKLVMVQHQVNDLKQCIINAQKDFIKSKKKALRNQMMKDSETQKQLIQLTDKIDQLNQLNQQIKSENIEDNQQQEDIVEQDCQDDSQVKMEENCDSNQEDKSLLQSQQTEICQSQINENKDKMQKLDSFIIAQINNYENKQDESSILQSQNSTTLLLNSQLNQISSNINMSGNVKYQSTYQLNSQDIIQDEKF